MLFSGRIDLLVRILADYISSTKGQSIIVESRPDGNTLLIIKTQ